MHRAGQIWIETVQQEGWQGGVLEAETVLASRVGTWMPCSFKDSGTVC